jgi:hypothetical protein
MPLQVDLESRCLIAGTVRSAAVTAAIILSIASASAPSKHNIRKATTIDASFDDTWTVLIDVFADRSWPIQNMAKDSGLITTDWMKADDGFADCGGSGIASTHGTFVRFNVRVKGAASTEVTVNATFREERSFDGQHRLVDCESKGIVEATIHDEIAKRIRDGAPATAKQIENPATAGQPRGHFCAASATAGLCTRERSDCEAAREAALAAVPDLAACSLVEVAYCFDTTSHERCFPTAEQCAVRGSEACAERK